VDQLGQQPVALIAHDWGAARPADPRSQQRPSHIIHEQATLVTEHIQQFIEQRVDREQ
jgi:hypothetical protein